MKTKLCKICQSFFIGIHEHVCDPCFAKLIKEQEQAILDAKTTEKGA